MDKFLFALNFYQLFQIKRQVKNVGLSSDSEKITEFFNINEIHEVVIRNMANTGFSPSLSRGLQTNFYRYNFKVPFFHYRMTNAYDIHVATIN